MLIMLMRQSLNKVKHYHGQVVKRQDANRAVNSQIVSSCLYASCHWEWSIIDYLCNDSAKNMLEAALVHIFCSFFIYHGLHCCHVKSNKNCPGHFVKFEMLKSLNELKWKCRLNMGGVLGVDTKASPYALVFKHYWLL